MVYCVCLSLCCLLQCWARMSEAVDQLGFTDQQQQLMGRNVYANVSPQALTQLGTAVQQFIEVVALAVSSRTPTASPKVSASAAAAGGSVGIGAAAAAGGGGGSPWMAAAGSRQQLVCELRGGEV